MAEPDKNEAEASNYKRLSRQNNLLFVAGALCVLAGVFFPKLPALVDLLMIFSLAVSAAVIAICLGARKPTELTGFALLAVTAVASLLTAAIASAKLIIIADDAGVIIGSITRLAIISRFLPTGLTVAAFAAISIVLLAATARSAGSLLNISKTYIEEVAAAEQTQPEFDLVAADDEQANFTAKEKGFFYAAHAFGNLVVWLCVLTSLVVLLSVFAAALTGKTSLVVPGKRLVSLVGSSGIVLQTSAFFVVLAVSHLVRRIARRSLQHNRMTEEQFQQRIRVVAREIAAAQTSNHRPCSPGDELQAVSNRILFDCNQFEDENSYDHLTNLLTESGSGEMLLMVACGPQYVPVTIPVNIAVRLTARGLKTLIIDFDLKRRAVQRVFETGNCDSRAVKTCIENISLISGKRLACAKPQALQQLFTKAVELYDYIIVYAPDAALPQQMYEFFTAAVFFGADNAPTNSILTSLIEELSVTTCQVLRPGHLFQPAYSIANRF
jgi:hypothetical protein